MPMNCPECGTPVGKGTPYDPYLHAASCLHFEARGKLESLQELKTRPTDRDNADKAITLIEFALEEAGIALPGAK